MASTNITENKFDQYLQEIQVRERNSRRRRLVKIGVILAILVGGFILFQQYTQSPTEKSWRTFSHDQLNLVKVNQLLGDDPAGIVVTHHLLGWDTIKTSSDYERFQELVDLIEITEEEVTSGPTFTSDETEGKSADILQAESSAQLDPGQLKTTEHATLKPFAIRINGTGVAGDQMKFTVINYDPSVRYTIDFGNSVTRRIQRSTYYTYPLSGNMVVRLIASSKDRGSSVYTKRLSIVPPVNQAIAARNQQGAGKSKGSLNSGDIDINEINQVTAYTVPRSSGTTESGPGPRNPQIASGEDINVIDLGHLENTESESVRNKPIATVDKPLVYAERMPSFPGGQKALKSYLKKHLKYPASALELRTQGQVIVQFIIEADGIISTPKILKGIGSGCDEEALRVVQSMPHWIPGESNGLRVPVYQSIPINFKLFE